MASTRGRQVVIPLTNKSGGGVIAGDFVIIDTSNNDAFTTTTSARVEVSVGVAQETIASNGTGRVLVAGYAALVNVPSSVTRGHYIESHTVVKQAAGSATRRSGSFGQFLTGGTTPDAWLWGVTDPTDATGGGGTASLIGLTAYDGGSDTSGLYSTASTTIVDADATNLIVTFTAPASGNILVRLSGIMEHTGGAGFSRWGLRESTTTIGEAVVNSTGTTLTFLRQSVEIYVTGVSAGAHTYKWAWRASAGTTYLTAGPTYGKLVMEVWGAP